MAGTFKETHLFSFGRCDTLKHVKVRDDQNDVRMCTINSSVTDIDTTLSQFGSMFM